VSKFRVRFVDGSEIYMEAESYEAAALALGECVTASTPIDVYNMDFKRCGTGLFNPNHAISIREVN
jgi:hypothetical protein